MAWLAGFISDNVLWGIIGLGAIWLGRTVILRARQRQRDN